MLEALVGILVAFIQVIAVGMMTVWSWIPDNLKLPTLILLLILSDGQKRRR